MNSIFEDREEFEKTPGYKGIYSNFKPFYTTITICAVIGISIIVLNFVFACCSRYSNYWNDRHTGNRWLISLWTATPHLQPPLDYTELKVVAVQRQIALSPPPPYEPPNIEYSELQKRESDI